MRLLAMALLLAASLGCDRAKSQPPQETPEAAKIRELEARVQVLEHAKPPHQYQLVPQGSRTFRFDQGTGESCIQLASKEDWKRADTIREGCEYKDWIKPDEGAKPEDGAALVKSAECFLVHNQEACKP